MPVERLSAFLVPSASECIIQHLYRCFIFQKLTECGAVNACSGGCSCVHSVYAPLPMLFIRSTRVLVGLRLALES